MAEPSLLHGSNQGRLLTALHLVGAEEADGAADEGERGYRFVAEEDAEGEGDYGDQECRAGGAAGGDGKRRARNLRPAVAACRLKTLSGDLRIRPVCGLSRFA